MLTVAASALVWGLASGQLMADDFEGTTLFKPAGAWNGLIVGGQPVTIAPDLAAAHRGDAGLSFTLTPDGGTLGLFGSWLELDFPIAIDAGTLNARMWMRERSTNDTGALIFAQFYAANVFNSIALETGFNHDFNQWHLQGYDCSGPAQSVVVGSPFTFPDWHLVEIELDGLGTDAGSRIVLVDGSVSARVDGLDLSAAQVTSFHLGADYLYQQLGDTVDLDDVRVDTALQAQTLNILVPPARVGLCTLAVLELLDWTGFERSSPYTFDVTLTTTAGIQLFSGSGNCSGPPLTTATFVAGSMGTVLSVLPTGPGLHTLRAGYVDYLTRPVKVAIGADAGSALTLGPDLVSPEARPANDGTQPAVANDGQAYFAVWGEPRDGDAGIYGARFGDDGMQLAPAFPISVEVGNREWPDVTFDGVDYLVTWDDARGSGFEIDAARVSAAGVVLDPHGVVISTEIAPFDFVPQVRCLPQSCLIVWSDRVTGYWAIHGRRFDRGLMSLDAADVRVLSTQSDRYLPRLSNADGGYYLVWSDAPTVPNVDLFVGGTRVDESGHALDGDGGLLSGVTDHATLRAALTWDGTAFWSAWANNATAPVSIELARLNAAGDRLPPPAGPDVGADVPQSPELAYDGVNVWLVYGLNLADGGVIGGIRYGLDGIAIEPARWLTDPAPWVGRPALSSDGQGHSLLVWVQGTADGGAELHHRLLMSTAGADGGSDAGVDGGSDGGIVGGVDGGPDAGIDGGADAGPLAPGLLSVGCGCEASPGGLCLAALMWLVRRHRTRRETQSAFRSS